MRYTSKIVILSLLAGMALNIAMAWSFAIWGTAPPWNPKYHSELSKEETKQLWNRYLPSDWPEEPNGIGLARKHKSVLILSARNYVATGMICYGEFNMTSDLEHTVCESQYGWPWRSMRCAVLTVVGSGKGEVTTRNGWQFANGIPWLGISNREVIPFEPIPMGFATNTLLYSMISLLLLAGPTAIRQRFRIRKGHCSNCGYNLKGTSHIQCPECGKIQQDIP